MQDSQFKQIADAIKEYKRIDSAIIEDDYIDIDEDSGIYIAKQIVDVLNSDKYIKKYLRNSRFYIDNSISLENVFRARGDFFGYYSSLNYELMLSKIFTKHPRKTIDILAEIKTPIFLNKVLEYIAIRGQFSLFYIYLLNIPACSNISESSNDIAFTIPEWNGSVFFPYILTFFIQIGPDRAHLCYLDQPDYQAFFSKILERDDGLFILWRYIIYIHGSYFKQALCDDLDNILNEIVNAAENSRKLDILTSWIYSQNRIIDHFNNDVLEINKLDESGYKLINIFQFASMLRLMPEAIVTEELNSILISIYIEILFSKHSGLEKSLPIMSELRYVTDAITILFVRNELTTPPLDFWGRIFTNLSGFRNVYLRSRSNTEVNHAFNVIFFHLVLGLSISQSCFNHSMHEDALYSCKIIIDICLSLFYNLNKVHEEYAMRLISLLISIAYVLFYANKKIEFEVFLLEIINKIGNEYLLSFSIIEQLIHNGFNLKEIFNKDLTLKIYKCYYNYSILISQYKNNYLFNNNEISLCKERLALLS